MYNVYGIIQLQSPLNSGVLLCVHVCFWCNSAVLCATSDPAGITDAHSPYATLVNIPQRMTAPWQCFFANENHAQSPLPGGRCAVETVDEPEAVSDTLPPNLEGLLG